MTTEIEMLLQALAVKEHAYRAALDDVQSRGGDLFKAVRAQHELTQRDLSNALDVDRSFVVKVESGKMRAGKPVLRRLMQWLAEHPLEEHTT